MALSESGRVVLDNIIATNKKAAFADPKVLQMLLDGAAAKDGQKVEAPDYVAAEADVAEFELLGAQCFTIAPKGGATSKVHMLYFHGGGFVINMAKDHWDFCLEMVKALGIAVTIPIYALLPNHGAKEVYPLMIAVYEHVLAEYQPEKVVVAGDSAGGHMTVAMTQLCNVKGLRQPDLLVAVSPWIDFWCELGDKEELDKTDPMLGIYGIRHLPTIWAPDGESGIEGFSANLIENSFEGTAPAIIICGSLELLRPDAEYYAQKLAELGIRNELLVMDGMWHTPTLFPQIDEARELIKHIEEVIAAL